HHRISAARLAGVGQRKAATTHGMALARIHGTLTLRVFMATLPVRSHDSTAPRLAGQWSRAKRRYAHTDCAAAPVYKPQSPIGRWDQYDRHKRASHRIRPRSRHRNADRWPHAGV